MSANPSVRLTIVPILDKVMNGLNKIQERLRDVSSTRILVPFEMFPEGGARKAGQMPPLAGLFGPDILGAMGGAKQIAAVMSTTSKAANKLYNQYSLLQDEVKKYGLTVSNTRILQQQIFDDMESQMDAVYSKAIPMYAALKEALRAVGYEGPLWRASIEQINAAMERHNSTLSRMLDKYSKLNSRLSMVGKRLAWFGFRLTMIGRMFSRNLNKILGKTIGQFKGWEKTIKSLATGLAFLIATGVGSGKAIQQSLDAMQKAPRVGMMMQGVLSQIAALFTNIGADVLPILLPAISDLIVALGELWKTSKDDVMEVFKDLAHRVIPDFINIIENEGPAAIKAFASGLASGVETLIGFIKWMGKGIGRVLDFMGWLMGMGPLVSGIGLALFGLSIALQALGVAGGAIIGVIKLFQEMKLKAGLAKAAIAGDYIPRIKEAILLMRGAWHQAGGSVLGFIRNLVSLNPVVAIIIAVVATLILWWKELSGVFKMTVGPAIKGLMEAWKELNKVFNIGKAVMTALKIATAPIAAALSILMVILSGLIGIVSTAIRFIAGLGQAFKNWLKPKIDALIAPLKTVGDILSKLFPKLFKAPNDLKMAMDDSKNAVDNLKDSLYDFKPPDYNDQMKDMIDDLGLTETGVDGVKNSLAGLADFTVPTFDAMGGSLDGLSDQMKDFIVMSDAMTAVTVESAGAARTAMSEYDKLEQSRIQTGFTGYLKTGGDELGDLLRKQSDDDLMNLIGVGGEFNQPATIHQTIPIEITINIENLSSEVDMDTLVDEMSRELANKIERVYR